MEQLPTYSFRYQNDSVYDRLEDNLRYLLQDVESTIYEDQAFVSDQEVILDMVVAGQRYLLIRIAIPGKHIELSPREQEIAHLIMKGLPNKAIAFTLGISPCTVATYLQRIFNKMDVNSRVEVVAKLLKRGIM